MTISSAPACADAAEKKQRQTLADRGRGLHEIAHRHASQAKRDEQQTGGDNRRAQRPSHCINACMIGCPCSSMLRGVGSALTHANLTLVAVALALHVAGLVVTGERWRVVIAGLGSRLSLYRTTLINLAGIFVRNATPTTGLGGDASRIALLRAHGVPLAAGDGVVRLRPARRAAAARARRRALHTGGRPGGQPIDDGGHGHRNYRRDRRRSRLVESRASAPARRRALDTHRTSAPRSRIVRAGGRRTPRSRRSKRSRGKSSSPRRSGSR